MRFEVTVVWAAGQEFRCELDGEQPLSHEAARSWLDAQFLALDCEPLRASGKVLLADKVLTVAASAGPALLAQPDWMQAFASAATAALARPLVRVDVPALTVTY